MSIFDENLTFLFSNNLFDLLRVGSGVFGWSEKGLLSSFEGSLLRSVSRFDRFNTDLGSSGGLGLFHSLNSISLLGLS